MARHIRQVALDDQTYETLTHLREANGITQKELMTRTLEWLAALDAPAQQLVIGRLPAEYTQDAVKRLADNAMDIAIRRQPGSAAQPAAAKRQSKRAQPQDHRRIG